MSHFAEIDTNGIIKRVVVANQDVIDSGIVGDPKNWVQTSYNINGGEYAKSQSEKLAGTDKDLAARNRKNYARIGGKYDKTLDAFISPKLYKSWTLNTVTCKYDPPKELPKDGKVYSWDELILDWVLL